MATKVRTEVIDVRIDNYDSLHHKCTIVDIEKDKIIDCEQKNKTKYLKFYTSLIGEGSPTLTDLPSNYLGEPSMAFRYDWLFDISCIPEKDKKVYWDWKAKLRDSNTVKVQLLFEPQTPKQDIFINVIYGGLLCLNPSKNTNSWFENNRESIKNSLSTLANTTKEYSKVLGDVFNIANMVTNFIASDDNGKNWYLYKFLDQEKNNFAIEWHINKRVLEQYGPMLQGSLIVNYHGSSEQVQKLKLRIRPFISFNDKDDLCYVSPYKDLKFDHCIEITPGLSK
ncbi:MAG: hypothetical protein EHM93_10460 [Bacteroidales bacterium]|nr:MAG: hypothetical protein EHM93_10460 [Bacteroidales bacterium]